MAAAITGCSAFNSQNEITPTIPRPTIQTTTIPPTQEILSKTSDQVVKEEAQRLGIKPSIQEEGLWTEFGFGQTSQRPINQEALKEAEGRIGVVLSLMKTSENPIFQETASGIENLIEQEKIKFTITTGTIESFESYKHIKFPMGVDATINNRQIQRIIVISADALINRLTSVIFAIDLVHEMEHVRISIDFENSLPSDMAIEEKLQREKNRISSIYDAVPEEARAYGKQAQSYMIERGLGYGGGVGLSIEDISASFIDLGKNPESPKWQRYIAQDILGIKNWQPKGN